MAPVLLFWDWSKIPEKHLGFLRFYVFIHHFIHKMVGIPGLANLERSGSQWGCLDLPQNVAMLETANSGPLEVSWGLWMQGKDMFMNWENSSSHMYVNIKMWNIKSSLWNVSAGPGGAEESHLYLLLGYADKFLIFKLGRNSSSTSWHNIKAPWTQVTCPEYAQIPDLC